MRSAAKYVLIGGILFIGACDEGTSDATTLERMRALGAAIRVHDDPARSRPMPGEQITVEWLVRGPKGPVEVAYELFVCPSGGRSAGVPGCEDVPLHEAGGRSERPTLTLTVPESYATTEEGGMPLLVLGSLCTNGRARFDIETLQGRCAGSDQEPETVSLFIDVGGDNHSPDLAGTEVSLDDERWPEEDCSTPLAPQEESTVRLRLSPSVREDTPEGPEELVVTGFVTAGALDRLFSVIERTERPLQVEIPYVPPDDIEAGEEVRFTFVIRDQRGGTDWLERCARVTARKGQKGTMHDAR